MDIVPSPGKVRCLLNVMQRIKQNIILGIWNVRTLNHYSLLKNIKRSRLSVNILRVCETRWLNNADFVSDKDMIIYAVERKMKEE